MFKPLDIIQIPGNCVVAIVDTVYADGSCTVWYELDTHSVCFMALPRADLWRKVG